MSYLLRSVSSHSTRSVSRQVSPLFRRAQDDEGVHRGLAAEPVLRITEAGISAWGADAAARTSESAADAAVQDEFIEAAAAPASHDEGPMLLRQAMDLYRQVLRELRQNVTARFGKLPPECTHPRHTLRGEPAPPTARDVQVRARLTGLFHIAAARLW